MYNLSLNNINTFESVCTYLTGNESKDPRIQNENKQYEDKNSSSDFNLILCQREELDCDIDTNLYWVHFVCAIKVC